MPRAGPYWRDERTAIRNLKAPPRLRQLKLTSESRKKLQSRPAGVHGIARIQHVKCSRDQHTVRRPRAADTLARPPPGPPGSMRAETPNAPGLVPRQRDTKSVHSQERSELKVERAA